MIRTVVASVVAVTWACFCLAVVLVGGMISVEVYLVLCIVGTFSCLAVWKILFRGEQ